MILVLILSHAVFDEHCFPGNSPFINVFGLLLDEIDVPGPPSDTEHCPNEDEQAPDVPELMIRGETMILMILHLLCVLHPLLFLHRPFVVTSHLGRHPLTRQHVLQALHAHHLLLHLLHMHQLLAAACLRAVTMA